MVDTIKASMDVVLTSRLKTSAEMTLHNAAKAKMTNSNKN